jgi:hypothetical protein
MQISAKYMPYLREQVRMMKLATTGRDKAALNYYAKTARVQRYYTCRYNEIGYIWCDTMAIKDGRTIITEQNLQYFPAKVRFYYAKS